MELRHNIGRRGEVFKTVGSDIHSFGTIFVCFHFAVIPDVGRWEGNGELKNFSGITHNIRMSWWYFRTSGGACHSYDA